MVNQGHNTYGNNNSQNSNYNQWQSLKQEGRASETNPLEDSLHYWAPEAKDAGEVRETRETMPDLRHRRKLLQIFNWKAGQANLDLSNPNSVKSRQFSTLLKCKDLPELDLSTKESLLYDIKDGVIGKTDEKWLLEKIADPINLPNEGPDHILNSLTGKQEKRILASFSITGFDNYEQVDKASLNDFLTNYPTPIEFDEISTAFVKRSGDVNGAAKEAEYRKSMDSFKHKVYGKRYEYHQAFKELQREAANLPEDHEFRGEKLSENVGYASISRPIVKGIKGFFADFRSKNPGYPENDLVVATRNEILKHQNEAKEDSEDSVLINEEEGLYGIFDGAGGEEGGQAASRLASRIVNSLSKRFRFDKGEYLAGALTMAGAGLVRAKRNGEKVGITTGSLVKVITKADGSKEMAYAHAGDSRIYIVHADGTTSQITRDEGFAHQISNYLGMNERARSYNDAGVLTKDKNTGSDKNVEQYGAVPLQRGDRIVLCSDGITGDKGSDLMSPAEIGHYVHNAKTCRGAAENLLGYARKTDDRSVIVVNPFESEKPKQPNSEDFLNRIRAILNKNH